MESFGTSQELPPYPYFDSKDKKQRIEDGKG